jgi:flagellar hook-length control protein FliK
MSKKTELDTLTSPETEELTPIQELHRIPVQWHAVEANPADAVAATLKPEIAQVVENALPASSTHLGVVDQTHTIERIEKLMLNEVVVMRASRPESLSVVLEPDKHTRLFVQMSTQDGAIQASVRCEAGDVARLQTHWKELQQTLAREGVELRDLEFSPEQRSGANLNFSGNQQKSPRDFTTEADRIVVVEAPRKAGKPVPMARRADDVSRQLLEFWA